MTSTELQGIVVSILRNLDPDNPAVRSFHTAFKYRNQHASTFESESGSLGLQTALERAFVVYTPDEIWSWEIEGDGTDMFFIIDLAVAAEAIPLDVYERVLRRLRRVRHEPEEASDVHQFIVCAFCAYARRKDENLSPGP